jgi:drug/metabolite transporter (DMT)-like permease
VIGESEIETEDPKFKGLRDRRIQAVTRWLDEESSPSGDRSGLVTSSAMRADWIHNVRSESRQCSPQHCVPSDVVSTDRSPRVTIQFLLLAAIWGSSFLLIKIGLEGLAPTQVVLARIGGGAVALIVISVVSRTYLPRLGIVWVHAAVVAVLLCVVPFLLFAWAEQHISSGLASIYNATTPLMTMLVAILALPEERPTPSRLTGLITGLIGVGVVLGPWRGITAGSGAAHAACLLATASYGIAFVYLRRFLAPLRLPALSVATLQVSIGALIMVALTPSIATQPAQLTTRVVVSMLLLGLLGTGLAYVWNTNIVAAWGATTASTVTYVTPVIGVALGIVLLAERVTWNQPLGVLLIIAGIALTRTSDTGNEPVPLGEPSPQPVGR